jgi:hypothetical protein
MRRILTLPPLDGRIDLRGSQRDSPRSPALPWRGALLKVKGA